ncbi:MAG TPA: hypothetical protein VMX74_03830 [Pirellulales bacterium]|nr:hypothetical protein [Pirellulales bacterium]
MTEAVEILIKADDQASQKFAAVAANANKAGQKTNAAFQSTARTAKTTTELVGALATFIGDEALDGVSQLAGMLAQATERASAFSDVANKGAAGALAFKLGLVGLAAAAGATVGKAIGDLIWQTARFERGLKNAHDAAKEFDSQLKKLQSTMFVNQREDIELIRDPEAKRAAYKQLLGDLNRDIQTTSDVVNKGKREVEEWAAAWKITGNRKAFEQDAIQQLAIDKERLATLKDQRDEIIRTAGARAEANERIRATNAAADEQERQAMRDKADALRDEEETRKRITEDAAKAAAKTLDDAKNERQRVDDLIASEEDRLELQRIELELGKEAAKVQSLINEGVDKETAKRLAAEDAAIEAIKEQRKDDGKPEKDRKVSDLQASQSRLLTRGSGSQMMDQTNKLLEGVQQVQQMLAKNAEQQLDQQKRIANNTAGTLTLRATV